MYVSPHKLFDLLKAAGFDVSVERQKQRFVTESGISKETAYKWFRKPIYNPTFMILKHYRDFLNSKLPEDKQIDRYEDLLTEKEPGPEEFLRFRARRRRKPQKESTRTVR